MRNLNIFHILAVIFFVLVISVIWTMFDVIEYLLKNFYSEEEQFKKFVMPMMVFISSIIAAGSAFFAAFTNLGESKRNRDFQRKNTILEKIETIINETLQNIHIHPTELQISSRPENGINSYNAIHVLHYYFNILNNYLKEFKELSDTNEFEIIITGVAHRLGKFHDFAYYHSTRQEVENQYFPLLESMQKFIYQEERKEIGIHSFKSLLRKSIK